MVGEQMLDGKKWHHGQAEEVVWNSLCSLRPFPPGNPSLIEPLGQGPLGMETLLLHHYLILVLLL